jgi:hypothetical protein
MPLEDLVQHDAIEKAAQTNTQKNSGPNFGCTPRSFFTPT